MVFAIVKGAGVAPLRAIKRRSPIDESRIKKPALQGNIIRKGPFAFVKIATISSVAYVQWVALFTVGFVAAIPARRFLFVGVFHNGGGPLSDRRRGRGPRRLTWETCLICFRFRRAFVLARAWGLQKWVLLSGPTGFLQFGNLHRRGANIFSGSPLGGSGLWSKAF